MTRDIAAIFLLGTILICVSGAPTTYDQRQDGDLNFSAKLENIMVVIATPSKRPTVSSAVADEIAAYLTLVQTGEDLLPGKHASKKDLLVVVDSQEGSQRVKDTEDSSETNDNEAAVGKPQKPAEQRTEISAAAAPASAEKLDSNKESDEVVRVEGTGKPKARNLWNDIGDVSPDDPQLGGSLKKELALQGLEDLQGTDSAPGEERQNLPNDHNEVGLLGNHHHYTLLGTGIEDCGPYRRRNSYGICQPISTE
ncbi:uncharacterized protein LOC105685314 [Athalia rosae]|uniref:uncharacterized protein LOC105685314 n=1 Tax=Athalia rosae TaxID=37344 RepID=UPI002034437D|nr:uncharacterized protein LOC105685314 [Athalia rosae]